MIIFNWKRWLSLLGVLAFLLILFFTHGKSLFWNATALGGLMIFFWIFEVVSIYITALFPLILAVPLGLLSTSDLAEAYGNGSVYLFFGGFILALGLEKWKVHEQIARRIVSLVGNSKPRILLGFLLSTGMLSMWISNTATALMMLPMAIAVIQAMPIDQQKSKFSVFLLLSIAYAASIGGMATLVGSPPNTQMASILEQNYDISISFFDWMKIGIPLSLTLLLAVFAYFYFALGKERNEIHDIRLEKKPWTVDQFRALAVFGLVVILWSFRELIIDATGFSYKDESAAIFGGILLFIIPSKSQKKPILEWQDTEKLPWGILLLFGGGLALAKMLEKGGVVNEITNVFSSFQNVSITVMIIAVVLIAIFATEIMSNLALVTIFVPIVAAFALKSGYPILELCLPLTLAASCAFMLPVGTPPNAIVFSSGLIKIHQMAIIGLILNIIATIIICLFAFLYF